MRFFTEFLGKLPITLSLTSRNSRKTLFVFGFSCPLIREIRSALDELRRRDEGRAGATTLVEPMLASVFVAKLAQPPQQWVLAQPPQ